MSYASLRPFCESIEDLDEVAAAGDGLVQVAEADAGSEEEVGALREVRSA